MFRAGETSFRTQADFPSSHADLIADPGDRSASKRPPRAATGAHPGWLKIHPRTPAITHRGVLSGRLAQLVAVAVCGCSLVGLAAVAGPVSSALGVSQPQVRVGIAPRPSSASKLLGSLATNTEIGVTVTLKPRDPAGLTAYAAAVATPGSSDYHDYLTVGQFVQHFGPTVAQIDAAEASLRAHGLNPGQVSANGLAIPVSATAGQLAQAFSTSFERVVVRGGRTAYANTSAPALDSSIAADVQGVIGLNTLALPEHTVVPETSSHPSATAAPQVATGGPQPCSDATTAASGIGAYTADQIASAYSFPGLYGAGDFGAGQTVALYELEGNFPADISAFQSCYGTSASVSYEEVDGGPATPVASNDDGLESELDIENVIGLAPEANVLVYQGPNSGTGAYDTYNAIVSQDKAHVVSISWALCEPLDDSAEMSAENTLFEEAAAQGESVVAASGDTGSEACYRSDPSDTGPSVNDPASQPFVTGVGGTSLTALGPPTTETVWNNSLGASGGGISTSWQMPTYQSGAPASLHVIGSDSSGAPCGARADSYCREVPDVSADADPYAAYIVYYNGNWIGVGGTSGATPT
jgi:subtilase family serine protease